MKSLVTTLLTLGLLVPTGAVYAFSIEDSIEAAKAGEGTYVESHSSVSTGGQTVRAGDRVHTSDASASSHTEIVSGNDGGEVKVKIETTENGETKAHEYTASIPKDENVKVEAKAESKDGTSTVEVKVNDEIVEAESQTASVAISTKVSLLFTERIPLFFKKLFSLFS